MKESKCLVLSLGHNSSALFYDGKNVLAYEQERLDKIKSSSAFPTDAIKKIESQCDINGAYLFISHWYDQFDVNKINDGKHFDINFVNSLVEKYNLKLVSLSKDFTHHDAHAYSSLSFLLNSTRTEHVDKFRDSKIHFIVADGFGNKQEVLSVYSCLNDDFFDINSVNLRLEKRIVGYKNSLGLMYQYATSFCGMKENQDEYKFLGYQSHIEKVLTKDGIEKLDALSKLKSEKIIKSMFATSPEDLNTSEDYINTNELLATKKTWHDDFKNIVESLLVYNEEIFSERVVVGHYIQNILEQVMSDILDIFEIRNVGLSGGLFYNVKLNNHILKSINGILSVIPITGDQGAGIGFIQKFLGGFEFKDLCYGKREVFNEDMTQVMQMLGDNIENLFITKDINSSVEILNNLISKDCIVNFVEGNMEFGPRALCHTSTLALPSSKNVEFINIMNKRNTVMPMAPVMLEDNLNFFFEENLYDRVIGSSKYMIITFDYRDIDEDIYRGVMHKYPTSNIYSGRPQVVSNEDNKVVKYLLKSLDVKCLINTSYNVHGNPILFDYKAILEDFKFQCDIAEQEGLQKPYLVLYV